MADTIAVLDFGSQYTQVIARRIRELKVLSRIYPYTTKASQLKKEGIKGIILSGGPASVLAKGAPKSDKKIFDLGIPVLGICYGEQLMAHMLGGKVSKSSHREFGHGTLKIAKKGKLFAGMPKSLRVWNSHGDRLSSLPKGFEAIASTENSPYATIQNASKDFYGMQFHPEVAHSEKGIEVLRNYVIKICGCKQEWSMSSYIEQSIQTIREQVGDKRVILGLSGGVDSSVAAALIHRAIGDQLTCIFVNNGLLRAREADAVREVFQNNFKLKLRYENATTMFLKRLKGITSPERKRKVIGKAFIESFTQATKKVGNAKFLAQGTLYPDIIESVPIAGNPAALIKSHHNVGGLPKNLKFELLEPLKCLFKDEVRLLGLELGLPKSMVYRHPFPGPGLGVRILGDVTRKRIRIRKEADTIVLEEMKSSGWYYKVWQAFAVLLPVKSVGVMGDERTYEYTIAVRVVESKDGMTADWVKLPYEVLEKISNRIINEVKGANRVCYDISSKPPATIEWE